MPSAKTRPDRRGLGLTAILALGFVAAGYSQAKLQTVERQKTLDLAKRAHRYVQTVTEHARRGSILAADGRPLAKDEDAYDLTVNFDACPHSPAFWMDVSSATGVSVTELQDAADSGAVQRVWPGAVAASERDRLKEICGDWRADGVSAGWSGKRDYPLSEAASSLVGVIRPKGLAIASDDHRYAKMIARGEKPEVGKTFIRDMVTGVEAGFNARLVGTDGKVEGLTDRHGLFMASRGSHVLQERADGKDVRLTLVPELQVAASAAIRRQVELVHAQSGVALIMDPKTGDLLAMANWPAPAPYRADGTENPLKEGSGGNPCYMSVLEPGSMFKILTLAKCLDVNPAVARSPINCTSHWAVSNRIIGCDDGRAHGTVDDRLAIAKSCNIAAGHWALGIGHDRFLQFLEDAGLRYRTKLGLPGESSALFPSLTEAKTLTTAVVGFGQSINCTPVQLIGAFSSIANGGVRMEPRVVSRVGDEDQPVEPGKRLFSEESARQTLSDMEAVMSPIGTGRSLVIPGYRLAGKSGTAQKLGSRQHGHVSNFIGFLPAQDPKVSILVMVNEPAPGAPYHGAAVAGKAWQEIAEAVIRHDHIKPTEPIPAKKTR